MINPTTTKEIESAADKFVSENVESESACSNQEEKDFRKVIVSVTRTSFIEGNKQGQQDMRNQILGMLRSAEDQRADSACGQADWIESELKNLDGVEK